MIYITLWLKVFLFYSQTEALSRAQHPVFLPHAFFCVLLTEVRFPKVEKPIFIFSRKK
jgi:hypothetical protein